MLSSGDFSDEVVVFFLGELDVQGRGVRRALRREAVWGMVAGTEQDSRCAHTVAGRGRLHREAAVKRSGARRWRTRGR